MAGELPAAGATEEDVLHLASTGGSTTRARRGATEERERHAIRQEHQPAADAGEPAAAGAPRPRRRPSPEERVLTFGDVFGRDAGGLIVLLVLFGALTLGSDEFLTGDNMANLARQVAVFGIIAVGQLLVILTAGIDLSVGSVLGLTGCITAELLVHGVGHRPGDPHRHGRRRRDRRVQRLARRLRQAAAVHRHARHARASPAAWCSC